MSLYRSPLSSTVNQAPFFPHHVQYSFVDITATLVTPSFKSSACALRVSGQIQTTFRNFTFNIRFLKKFIQLLIMSFTPRACSSITVPNILFTTFSFRILISLPYDACKTIGRIDLITYGCIFRFLDIEVELRRFTCPQDNIYYTRVFSY